MPGLRSSTRWSALCLTAAGQASSSCRKSPVSPSNSVPAIATISPMAVTNPPPGGVSNPVNFSVTPQPVDPMEGQYALSVTVNSPRPECATLPDGAKQENDECPGGHIVEQIPQTGWIELTGNRTSPVSNDVMSARGDGSLWSVPTQPATRSPVFTPSAAPSTTCA